MSIVILFVLAVSGSAQADGDPRFDAARAKAKTLTGGLSAFLESYVGGCGPVDSECLRSAREFQLNHAGKKFYFVASEEASAMLSAVSYSKEDNLFRLRLTPFFTAGGYALTQGTPRRIDARGNPQLLQLTLEARLPEDVSDSQFARMVSTRSLTLEIVFTPQRTWTLARHQGVAGKLDAVLVRVARTGEAVAIWLPD
ncbi:MAG: DUF6066 family protein [Myxococcaceae bacterium]